MDNQKFDKYVEYVLAQVGEGRHTKEDIKMDLHERGLSDAEINEVLDVAWRAGAKVENEAKETFLKTLPVLLCVPVFMCVILYFAGLNIFESCSFYVVIGGIIALIGVLFHKKKFR